MKELIVFIFLYCSLNCLAQKNHGINWVEGGAYTHKVHFKNTVPFISNFLNGIYFAPGSSCISDTDGNFKILCNGFKLMDSTGTTIEGGDTITPSKLCIWEDGFSLYSQFSIILPFRNDIYYVVTATASDDEFDTHWMLPSPYQSFDLLLYSKVDMKLNNGLGKVVKKAIPISENKLLSRTQMMACRHADGANWWLLKQAKDSNTIYKYIVTEDSVYNAGLQDMGEPYWGNNDIKGQIMFNTQGTQYATVAWGRNLVFLADFNRCTGNISNPQIRYLPIHSRSASILTLDTLAVGVCFSPNDSLLYVVKDYNLYQLDLHDPDSLTAWYRVANMDTTYDQFQKWSCLYPGPDGKIYVGNWNGLGHAMSYIENPNVKGAGCNFCPKCLQFGIPSGVNNPPCMPNYELGKDSALLVGCTPVSSGEIREVSDEMLVVYPNPASSKLEVRYEIRDVSALEDRRNASIEMYNAIGQRVYSSPISHLISPISIDVSNLSKGVYYLRCGNQVVKVVVE
jgi:hypothetical protein